jgi:hypothetical protein
MLPGQFTKVRVVREKQDLMGGSEVRQQTENRGRSVVVKCCEDVIQDERHRLMTLGVNGHHCEP